MQLSAPEAFDVMREPESVRTAYGLGNKVTDDFGRRCLLATRLIERGVRFVQVWSGPQGAVNNWDTQKQKLLNSVRSLYYQALGDQLLIQVRSDLAGLAKRAVAVSKEMANVGQADRPDLLDRKSVV